MNRHIDVKRLTFEFEMTSVPHQYEVSGRTVSAWPRGTKVVDIVVNSPGATSWFIEVKDFRVITKQPNDKNLSALAQSVAEKVQSSIEAMPIVAALEVDDVTKTHATVAAKSVRRRAVLHIEPHPPDGPSKHLFPSEFPADVLQKLKRLLVDVAPGPLVLDIARTSRTSVPWRVR